MKHIVLATRAPIAVQPHHLRACRPRVIERGRNDRRERHCWLVAALAAVLHLAVQSQAAIASGRIEPRREVVSPIDSAALDARRSGPLGNHDTAGAAAAGDARSNVDDEVDLAEPPETPLDPDGVHLRIGTFVPERSSSLHRPGQGALPRPGWFVIQLEGPVDPTKRASLASRGVVLRSYLPSNAFIVRLTSGFDAPTRLGDLDFVRWIGPFQDDWKVSPELGQREFATAERQKLAAAGWNRLTVTTFDATNLGADLAALGALPGLGIASWAPVDPGAPRDGAPDADSAPPQGVIEVVAPRGIEAMIAALDGVQWIEDAPEATLRNSSNKWIVQSNVPESAIVWSKGIRGDGQIGGLIDGGVKKTHCSFKDPEGDPPGPNHRKLAAYFGSSTADEHGTHVAGTFAGDEQPISGSTTLRGMAYRARIAFTNLATITSTNLAAKLKQNHDAGARVHSNSWGDDGTNSYTSWSHDIDLFSWDNQDDLVLFAVTNLDTTVRNPENAKNCLAVAASQDAPNQSAHCSGGHGNTKDGRRKPEVFAPGCDTLSSDSSTTCGFVGLTGTSMACPAVAGAGILVRQYFLEGWYPSGAPKPSDSLTPSGALLKAMLVNSATDMTDISGYPSKAEGWGRVLLDNALYFAGDSRHLKVLADIRNGASQALATGETRTYTFTVSSVAEPLRLTMVFTDKEATVNANPATVNDLNLEVTTPAGAVYKGNVLSYGHSALGGSADSKNNVEQALFLGPSPGTWSVRVSAAAVNTATNQGFALIATGGV